MQIDERSRALLDALNDLFAVAWVMTPGSEFYAFTLTICALERENFVYHRSIKPGHINGEPYRTALQFADEVCERYGRFLLLRPEEEEI
jgi:hypothetical protein